MNIDNIIKKSLENIELHKISTGKYTRYVTDPQTQRKDVKINAYGVADAANLLYTLDAMPKDIDERKAFADTLKSFQDRETGLFDEGTHHPYHGTAHCMGALELFDELPLYPIKGMDKFRSISAIPSWLEGLSWSNCRGSGHIGAGVFSAMYLERTITKEWQEAFFGWLEKYADPDTGINLKGMIDREQAPVWLHMGDWFHFLFCFYAGNRAFPYADKLVDSCLDMYYEDKMDATFGKGQRFLDIDWIFTLNHAAIQSGHRFKETKEALRKFAKGYIEYLDASPFDECQWNDLHLCFGAICALSELQRALPGEITSARTLRQILDRRPFI